MVLRYGVLTTRGTSRPRSRNRPARLSRKRVVFSGPWFFSANSKTDSSDPSQPASSASAGLGNTRKPGGDADNSFFGSFTLSRAILVGSYRSGSERCQAAQIFWTVCLAPSFVSLSLFRQPPTLVSAIMHRQPDQRRLT